MPRPPEATVGVLLAGGLSRRMGGGDKCLRPLAGVPILCHVIDRIAPQVATLVLNANGDPARFSSLGLPVVADSVTGYPGPLAGVLTGMDWAADNAPDCAWIVTVPTDAPFVPRHLVTRLHDAVAAEGADMACAASGGRTHPVVGLWPVRLREALRAAVVEEAVRKVDRWTGEYRLATVAFDGEDEGDGAGVDPFFNVNRPEDLAAAERLAGSAR